MSLGKFASLVLVLVHAGFAFGMPTQASMTERLEYEASYKGPLTADEKIPIASLSLETRKVNPPALTGPLSETSLEVSSGMFPFVEENFPFRVRIRSLYRASPFTVLALEKYRLTDELRHELTWVDRGRNRVSRYRVQGDGHRLPAAIGNWVDEKIPFRYYKPARHKILDGLVDRLSMLQSLRLKQMMPGAEYRFSVTDGKHLLDYRARVAGLEQIRAGGKQQLAWKLVLNAQTTRKGVTTPDHGPIHLWLSKDQAARPLRFSHQHPLGAFIVELRDVIK